MPHAAPRRGLACGASLQARVFKYCKVSGSATQSHVSKHGQRALFFLFLQPTKSKLAASRLVLCKYEEGWRYDTEKDTTVDSTHDVFTTVFFSNTN